MSKINNSSSDFTLTSAIDYYPLTVSLETPLKEIISLMSQHKNYCQLSVIDEKVTNIVAHAATASCVLVLKNKQIRGLITERDIVRFMAHEMKMDRYMAQDVMTQPVITLKNTEIQDIFSILHILKKHQIRHLPIVNKQNQLVGLITSENIRNFLQPLDFLKCKQVREVMTTEIINAPQHTSLLKLAKLMAEHHISCIVIVGHTDLDKLIPLGIITERDLLQYQAIDLSFETIAAETVMSTPLFSVSSDTSLWSAYQAMEEKKVRRLVVVDADNFLEGILTQANIYKAIEPVGMYSLIEILQQKVTQLKNENFTLLQQHNSNLEKQLQLEKLNQQLNERLSKRAKQLGKLVHQLEKNKIFVQKISETNPNIIYLYDFLSKSNTYLNKKIMTLLGYETEEMNLMEKDLFYQIIHEEDLGKMEDYHHKFATAKDGEIREIEYRIKDTNGELHWLLSRDIVFSRTKEGKPKQILGTAIDITEIKQIKAKSPWFNEDLFTKVEELKQRNKEITLLNEIHDFLQASLTVEEACNVLGDLLQPLFPHMTGAIFMCNSLKNSFEMIAHWGDEINTESFFLTNQCWAIRRGRLHHSKNNQLGLSCDHVLGKSEFEESFCIPLIAQGEALGLFSLSSLKGQIFTDLEKKLASTVGEQIALALSNLQLQEQLQEQNIRDALTNLFNRRYLTKILDAEIKIAFKNKQSLAVLMIDIDYFKRFNDTYGHDAGDKVLQELAMFLQQNIKQSDIACRYGGEELTLILKDISPENAYRKAELLRKKVKLLELKHNNNFLGEVTISVGLACCPAHANTQELLLKLADEALYKAKNQGRDRVVISQNL